MKKLISVLAVLLLPMVAQAQSTRAQIREQLGGLGMPGLLSIEIAQDTTGNGVMPNAQWLYWQNAAGTPTPVVKLNASDAIEFAGSVSFSAGAGPRLPVYVPTLVSTPVAGTNDIKIGFNAIPTVAANAAACLPQVPTAGDVAEGRNIGANTVRVKACGTPGINGAASGTYIPVATQAYFKCAAESATAWACGTFVVPTPAGP